MTQFKVKNGKNSFQNFEKFTHQLFRHIPGIINTFYVVIESRIVFYNSIYKINI